MLVFNPVFAQDAESPEQNYLKKIEVFLDSTGNQTFEEVRSQWELQHIYLKTFFREHEIYLDDRIKVWTRLIFVNSDSVSRLRVLHFPKGWYSLSCYLPRKNGVFTKKNIGIKHRQEVLYVRLPPRDTTVLFVQYPSKRQSIFPSRWVSEMSEQAYLRLNTRTPLKFLLLGAILFPILFFLTQFMVEKDRLTLSYLVFLTGSTLNLVTILETIPYFDVNPKIVGSMPIIARMFVASVFLTLLGLVKYVHFLLDFSSWSPFWMEAGDVLLLLFLAAAMVPFLFPFLFNVEYYDFYLQYYRIFPLITLLYISGLCISALRRKIKYSRLLLFAFSPFLFSAVVYTIVFIFLNNYSQSSLESLMLIFGFLSTLFFFGIVLGLRNNEIKIEKLGLEQETKRLNELDQFKSRFYTNITHEFRTPLTVIKGMSGQIDGQDRVKAMIRRNSERLLEMVNQLLDLSKSENNQLALNWVHGDIIPFLRYLTESCHSVAGEKKINLAFFSKEEKLEMDFDEDKIQKILLNLLSNAIKFTPEYGSVKIITSKESIEGRPYLSIEVKDTGKGISPEKLPHIFERFFQVDDTATRRHEGSGIGLALTKELVHTLKGNIEVTSQIQKGTVFKVILPVNKKAAQKIQNNFRQTTTAEPSSSAADNKTTSKKEKPHILIIEDNSDVRSYIVTCLQELYITSTARNGIIGLEKAYELIPDAIICDIMMPEMDGYEVCQKLKTDRRTSHIPIIMLSAKASQEDKVMGLEKGADAYLIKPFDQEELLMRLKNLTHLSFKLREKLTSFLPTYETEKATEQREVSFLREVQEIIHNNLSNPSFDTNFLCQAIAMSRTQLHRKLKALTGQSTASYIRSIRLNEAKYLLEKTDLPIGEVVLKVGYKDFSHFSRSFAKEFGIKPSESRG